MSALQGSRRIFWMVRLLAALGLTTIIVLIGLDGRQVSSIHAEREKLQKEQARLYQTSEAILASASEARAEIIAILDANVPAASTSGTQRLDKMVDDLIATHNHPFALDALMRLDTLTDRMSEVARRAITWRAGYDTAWQDISKLRTMGQVRDLIASLRGAVESLDGRQREEEAARLKRWRAAKGEEAAQFAQSIVAAQDGKRYRGTDLLEIDLAEIQNFVFLLAGEEQPDKLQDLKDRHLAPAVDRLSQHIELLGDLQDNTKLFQQTVEQLKTALFGRGYAVDAAHHTISTGTGGLYALRRDLLQLRSVHEELSRERSTLSLDIDAMVASFMLSTRDQSASLEKREEQDLDASWRRMMAAGMSCSVIFLILTGLISRAIRAQVDSIELAKSQAEVGRQSALRLMHERELAQEELRDAHMQIEQLVACSPAVIFRAKVEGASIIPLTASANITALLGFTAEETLSFAWWLDHLHPEDRDRVIARASEAMMQETSRCEYRMRHKEGSYVWIDDNQRVLRDASGQPTEIIGIWVDITERKHSEQALRESEQHMRLQTAALEAAANGIVITDSKGSIQWVNPAFTQLTGYSAEEATGQNSRILKSGQHPASFYEEMKRAMYKGRVWKGEIINRRKDGELYHEEMVITPILDASGIITHFVAIKQDISVRKRVEAHLLRKTALHEAQLASSLDGILVVDDQNRQIIKNKQFNEVWRIPPHIAELSDDAKTLQFATSQARNPQQFIEKVNYLYAHPQEISRDEIELVDGTFLDRYSAPVEDESGKNYGRIWTFRDITERKQAEATMQEMHRKLLESSRTAGMAEIATNVLHNVGNVLNSVNVSASVAADKVRDLKVEMLEKLGAMLREQQDLAAFLTNDPRGEGVPAFLVTLAERFASDRAGVLAELAILRQHIEHINEIVAMQQNYANVGGVTEVLPLADLIEDALRINAGSIERHGLNVIREYAEVPPTTVDRHKLLQILVNLIRNAKHALDDGAPAEKRLGLKLSMNGGGHAKIQVSDNGIGIPSENLSAIFAHGFSTRAAGHGFGLHSAANAAREMGGNLTVQSDGPGCGATFILEIPVQIEPHTP